MIGRSLSNRIKVERNAYYLRVCCTAINKRWRECFRTVTATTTTTRRCIRASIGQGHSRMFLFYFFIFCFCLIASVNRNIKKAMTTEDQQLIVQLEQKILKRKAQINEIEQSLPQKNSLCLKVCILYHLS